MTFECFGGQVSRSASQLLDLFPLTPTLSPAQVGYIRLGPLIDVAELGYTQARLGRGSQTAVVAGSSLNTSAHACFFSSAHFAADVFIACSGVTFPMTACCQAEPFTSFHSPNHGVTMSFLRARLCCLPIRSTSP